MRQHASTSPGSDIWVIGLIYASTVFNFGLSFANAHVLTVTSTMVQAIQLLITGLAALIVVLRGGPRLPLVFPVLVCAFLALCLIAGVTADSDDIKTIYDVVMVCIFIALGTTVARLNVSLIHGLMALCLAVAFFEFFFPSIYTELVNPLSYFTNTRDWVAELVNDNFNDGPGLYIGTLRGSGEAWLGLSVGGHRVGGVFLEPLNQGYFAVVAAIFYFFYYRDHFWKGVAAFVICIICALLSDTRIAVMLIAFIFVAGPVFRRLPPLVAFLVAPAGLLAVWILYLFISDKSDVSEFAFRLSLTYQILMASPVYNVLFGGVDLTFADDSGIVTFVSRAGFVGMLIVFLLISGLTSMYRRDSMVLISVSLYLLVTSLFGAAFLSIKTAALFGVLVGATGTGAFAPKPRSMPRARPVNTGARYASTDHGHALPPTDIVSGA